MKPEHIISHPCYDLTLKQLRKERKEIERFNKKVDNPNHPFWKKKIGFAGIDRIINHKLANLFIQQKLF